MGAFFGCLLRGALAVPLDVTGSPEFAARVIRDTSPRLLLTDKQRHTLLRPSVPQMSLDSLEETLPDYPAFAVSPAVTPDAPFQIIFTSGTTAEPKGIVHTHRNVLASLDPIEQEIAKYRRYERLVHPLRFLHTLPLSHVFGQFMGLWTPALLAAEVHLESQLELGRLLGRIGRKRISVLIAVPRTLELLRSHLNLRFPEIEEQLAASARISLFRRLVRFHHVHALTGWKFWAVISGGATLPPALELFWGRLGYAVIQGYGMTETAALVTLNHPFHVGRGTLGKPSPGREVRLSDEGEIVVRGDVVSTSTWTDGRIQPRTSEWLATGDLATQDESGEFRFTGRRGDTIVTAAGLNIYPADLETELLKQPGIRAAAVVACEGVTGPEPVAVLLPDGSMTLESLRLVLEQANQSLADFQQMRHVLRWPEPSLPYTSTGKLLRRTVAAWACDQLSAPTLHPAAPNSDVLIEMIATITGKDHHNASDNSRISADLYLDSLGRIQLQSLLEQRFGLDLPDELMAQAQTLGDLCALTGIPTKEESGNAEEKPSLTLTSVTMGTPSPDPSRPHPVQDQYRRSKLEHRYPMWPWLSVLNWLRVGFQELIARPLVFLLAAPRVERRAIAPKGPLLIIANHLSAYDVPLVLYGLPITLGQRVAVAMSGEMLLDFRDCKGASNALHGPDSKMSRELAEWLNALMPLAYWLLTALFNVFPLPRLGGFRRSFEHAGAALDRGYSVLIFPEGHRSADGLLQPFRAGIGLLAQQAQAAVLPVALLGLTEAKRHWFRSGCLTIRVGEVIPYSPESTPEEITQQLYDTMAKLVADEPASS